MDALLFIVKYTPFWAIPCLMICVYFTYTYWIKDLEIVAYLFAALSFVCFVITCLWIWAGGPEKSVELIFTIIETV